MGTEILNFFLFEAPCFELLETSDQCQMHADHESDFFVDLFVFEGDGEELEIFGFLLGDKFGEVLLDGRFDDFVRDLFVIEANGLVSEVFVDFLQDLEFVFHLGCLFTIKLPEISWPDPDLL